MDPQIFHKVGPLDWLISNKISEGNWLPLVVNGRINRPVNLYWRVPNSSSQQEYHLLAKPRRTGLAAAACPANSSGSRSSRRPYLLYPGKSSKEGNEVHIK